MRRRWFARLENRRCLGFLVSLVVRPSSLHGLVRKLEARATFRNPKSRSAATRDRRERARPSPRRSARRVAARRDRGGPAWRASFLRARPSRFFDPARSSPLLIPPCTPPELFVVVRIFSSRTSKGSLCSEPFIRVAAKPEPISKPFEAGKLNIAFARSASSLSKTGSPSPAGTPRITHSITPPNESPSSRTD
jgi:hypothetical protein